MLVASVVLCGLGYARTWTDFRGKSIEADFVSYEYGMVTLKTLEGNTLKISLSKLSKDDQAFVKEISAEKSDPKTLSFNNSSKTPVSVGPVAGDPEVVKLMVPGKVFRRTASGDHAMTYHVYTPTGFDAESPPPLIISFSPGGSGVQMVNSMKASAEKAGWVLIGCDRLSNTMKEAEPVRRKMEDEVLSDIYTVIPNNPDRIYLAGLSGGALRAYNLSARREERITGIIAYGGWLGGEEYSTKEDYCKYMAVAIVNGDNDKAANSWIAKDEYKLKKHRCSVKHFSFPGGHVIAPASVIDEVILWLKEDWEQNGVKRTKWR